MTSALTGGMGGRGGRSLLVGLAGATYYADSSPTLNVFNPVAVTAPAGRRVGDQMIASVEWANGGTGVTAPGWVEVVRVGAAAIFKRTASATSADDFVATGTGPAQFNVCQPAIVALSIQTPASIAGAGPGTLTGSSIPSAGSARTGPTAAGTGVEIAIVSEVAYDTPVTPPTITDPAGWARLAALNPAPMAGGRGTIAVFVRAMTAAGVQPSVTFPIPTPAGQLHIDVVHRIALTL